MARWPHHHTRIKGASRAALHSIRGVRVPLVPVCHSTTTGSCRVGLIGVNGLKCASTSASASTCTSTSTSLGTRTSTRNRTSTGTRTSTRTSTGIASTSTNSRTRILRVLVLDSQVPIRLSVISSDLAWGWCQY